MSPMIETGLSVGCRVRVAIPSSKRKEWASGAAEALDGTTGKIEEFHKKDHKLALVLFDKPAKTWHANQTPPTGFWFGLDELQALMETE